MTLSDPLVIRIGETAHHSHHWTSLTSRTLLSAPTFVSPLEILADYITSSVVAAAWNLFYWTIFPSRIFFRKKRRQEGNFHSQIQENLTGLSRAEQSRAKLYLSAF